MSGFSARVTGLKRQNQASCGLAQFWRIRAIGLGAMAVAAVMAPMASALAQTPANRAGEAAREYGAALREKGDLLSAARQYHQYHADKCRTTRVEDWIADATALEDRVALTVADDPEFIDLQNELNYFVRLPPCPGLVPAFQQGAFVGFYVIKVTGDGRIIERLNTNDQITNVFDVNKDPVGAGAMLGYKFAPWSNSVVVAPFVSVDWPNISVNQTFANGSFLGTTSNVSATFGVKIGPQFQNVWLYGTAGVSVLNETLKVNFIPVASSTDANVAGATVGAGFAFQPRFLQKFSHPVSLFAEYQHTWWDDAHFNAPAASPFFNYTFRRQDDVVKLGFTVSLSAPPPVAAKPSYPVKALPSKSQ